MVQGDRRKEVALAAVAVTIVFTGALSWYRRRQKVDKKVVLEEPAPSIASINKSSVDPQIWRSFEEAAHRIRTDKALAKTLTPGDKLMFYGLFKHIVSGDAPSKLSMNGFNVVVEQAKHAAWSKMRGIPVPMAITHYRAAVQHFAEQTPSVTTNSSQSTAANREEEKLTEEDMADGGFLGPAVVSRPAVDNGGIAEEDDGSLPEVQLLRAAGENDLTALTALLNDTKGKLDVNHQDESGQTALHLAADKDSTDCLILLLKAGADVNAVDHDGISVLQAATIAGHVRICRLLLDHGANADQADDDGDTPRSCANDDGDEAMKQLFGVGCSTINEEE